MGDLFEEGLFAFREGKYEDAGELFKQRINEDDQNPKVWNALGICLSKLGENDDAVVCFENALVLDPKNQTYSKNLEKQQKKNLKLNSQSEQIILKKEKNNRPIIHYFSFIGILVIILIVVTFLFFSQSESKPIQEIDLEITPIVTPTIIATSILTPTPTTIIQTPIQVQDSKKLETSVPLDSAFNEIYIVSKSMADKKDYDERYYVRISDLSKSLSYYLKYADPYLKTNIDTSNYQFNRLKTDLLVAVNKYSSERDFINPPQTHRVFEKKVFSLAVNLSGSDKNLEFTYSADDLLTDPIFINMHNSFKRYSQDEINNLINPVDKDKELNAYLDELKRKREEADQQWLEDAKIQRQQKELEQQKEALIKEKRKKLVDLKWACTQARDSCEGGCGINIPCITRCEIQCDKCIEAAYAEVGGVIKRATSQCDGNRCWGTVDIFE